MYIELQIFKVLDTLTIPEINELDSLHDYVL